MLVQPAETTTGVNDFDGTIAPDFLQAFDVDFDFGGHMLNLFSPKHCPGKVVYWAAHYGTVPFQRIGSHIVADVTLDGHDFRATVDTGASVTALRDTDARSFFALEEDSPDNVAVPGATADSIIAYRHRFSTLKIGDVTVKDPMIAIFRDKVEESYRRRHSSKSDFDPIYGTRMHAPAIVLGMDVLTKLHFYIAYGEKTIYVTAVAASAPPNPPATK